MAIRSILAALLWIFIQGNIVLIRVDEKGGAVNALASRAQAHDEETLRNAGFKTDGEGVLLFFKKRTLTDAERTRLENLVRDLGDDRFPTRENASMELSQAGPLVAPLLRAALKDADLEIVKRAQRCLEKIDASQELPVGLAAARLIADRRPPGAAKVILDFLQFATDPLLEEELLKSLTIIALEKSKADDVVVQSLTSKIAVQCAAASYVVAQSAETTQRDAVLTSLHDRDADVRFRAAQGLLLAKDSRALPVLVDLLAEGPLPRAWQCEEMLFIIAGEKSPNAFLGAGDAGSRTKVRKCWQQWLEAEGQKIDLNRLERDTRPLGLTLCIAWDCEKSTKRRRV